MKTFPHRLLIFAASAEPGAGGSYDDDGVYTPDEVLPSIETIYDGRADVQDGGKMFRTEVSGQHISTSNAVAFLQQERFIGDIAPGMMAEVTWEDGMKDVGTVEQVRRLDGTVWLRYL